MSNHLQILREISLLSARLAGREEIDTYLGHLVQTIAKGLEAAVCSVYLYRPNERDLLLRGTHGLAPETVGQVRLTLDQGLVGQCFRDRKPVCLEEAHSDPAYYYVPGSEEEKYDAFLAMPVQRGDDRLGVLVLQRESTNPFDKDDQLALSTVALQLAAAFENARVLVQMRRHQPTTAIDTSLELRRSETLHRGQAASPGFAEAPALVLDKGDGDWLTQAGELGTSLGQPDLERALEATEQQLLELQERLEERLPEVASLIFEAHLLMLADDEFAGAMRRRLAAGETVTQAVAEVAAGFVKAFSNSPSPFIQEKANDVKDLARRLIGNLLGRQFEASADCQGKIVLAHEMFPSDILKLASERVAGLVTFTGGINSHVAILARSLGVPMVIASQERLLRLPDGCPLLLDAEEGNIFVNPPETVRAEFSERNRARAEVAAHRPEVQPETYTRDGTRVRLLANINLLSDLQLALELRAEGIGLYRTEFPFLVRGSFPSAEEQATVYTRLVAAMPEREINVRTLDAGGDKLLPFALELADEPNPALGLRSIRYSLHRPELLREQVRGILLGSAAARNLRIMFPMVTSIDEFLTARAIVEEVRAQLVAAGAEHCPDPAIGMMVEVPALVPVIADVAKVSDFLCIGSNDFTQYMLAVDRGNERLSGHYLTHHPAVLRGLADIAVVADRVPVSMCGEMAHEITFLPFLLGIGLRTLSLNAQNIPQVQAAIGRLDLAEARAHAQALLAESTVAGTTRVLAEADWERRLQA